MHQKKMIAAGKPLQEAANALIMVHGRGADARDILGLATHLDVADYALLAPVATNNTWYPYSFMAKEEENEPWLSGALTLLSDTVAAATAQGISTDHIYLLGFSQGACLALEFAARHAQKFGGIAAFTGGLIGEKINEGNYSGDFKGTPVFIATGDPDAHVPVERVRESVTILEKMNARVQLQVQKGRPHTITQEELAAANKMIFNQNQN